VGRKKIPKAVSEFFSKMGKKGGPKGGHARAAKMTQEERSASAKKAVDTRWAKVREKKSKGV